MKINRPPMFFQAHLHLSYRGDNHNFYQKRCLTKIRIVDIDYNLKEEMLVKLKMFDDTEIMFSMISANLYKKVNDKYELQDDDHFCDFELSYDEKLLFFNGHISYENSFGPLFLYREAFETRIILPNDRTNKELIDIWVKHDKTIL